MTDLMRAVEAVRQHLLSGSREIIQDLDPMHNGYIIAEKFIDLIGQLDLSAIVASVETESERRERAKDAARERLSKLPELKVEVGEVLFIEREQSEEQKPVAYLCADLETGKVIWGEACVCQDAVFDDEVNHPGCFSLPVYTHPQPAIPPGWKLVPMEPVEEMIGAAYTETIEPSEPPHRVFGHLPTILRAGSAYDGDQSGEA